MKSFEQFCKDLESAIESAYTEGISMEEAEKLAGKFLGAQLAVNRQLSTASLDARMRKAGVKAVRAAVYLSIVQSEAKKPTEAQIEHTINTTSEVSAEQDALDRAEVSREELERFYDIFGQAHIHFRTIAKGAFNG